MDRCFGLPLCYAVSFLIRRARWVRDAVLLSAHLVTNLQAAGFAAAPRTDGEPVPKPVRREAYIEYAWGQFYFVLEEDGKARIWQPWELVRQFEKVDYWSMFGDAGGLPRKTGWHAIAMTPLVGQPWLDRFDRIEAEAEVRERFTELDARFSADTRTRFMRALEARKSSTSRQTVPQTEAQTEPDGGAPARPAAKGVPDKL